jgi:hypothetical protein
MPRLKGYRFSRLVVDGEEQTRDLVVLPERVTSNLGTHGRTRTRPRRPPRRPRGASGAAGRGYGRIHPDPEAVERLRRECVEAEALPTADAFPVTASSKKGRGKWSRRSVNGRKSSRSA